MIEFLRVRDFAIVDRLDLALGPGLTVLTGETGAGKSILLQALGLLLGDRASRDWVRAGAREARVEGAFAPAAPDRLGPVLEQAGVAWDPAEPLVVTRVVAADGRSRAHLNGALVPVHVLARVGEHLVEVSSQHQHQSLLREEEHLALLDQGLDEGGRRALAGWQEAFGAWRSARAEVERLERLDREGRDRAEFLRFQAGEIRAAGLEPGEDDRLRAELELLAHATKLREAYEAADSELYTAETAALARLGRARRALETAARWDPEAGAALDMVAQAVTLVDEAAAAVRRRAAQVEADPARLEAVEDRLQTIRRLERKHGGGVEAILEKLAALEAELAEIEDVEWGLERARTRLGQAEGSLARAADDLRAARRRAARDLERRVADELSALAMGGAAFRVEMEPAEPGPRGADRVRFLLAANPGEPARPLARVASGGELSRLLLALKNALRTPGVGSLVFDEVDAGIGGATADAVAERLARIAGTCQVLCITHLPQIAVRASRHLRVEKAEADGRTVTRVKALEGPERIGEVARMMGGRNVTETSLRHAQELVERFAP